uniref:Putative LOV domain-containing protein n=1 Tax=Radula lindenbergiana TaxID=697108 RepID=A0A126WVD4_9MARC|nr:putative LOV domain-containing protein [Radula lindenbergiana]
MGRVLVKAPMVRSEPVEEDETRGERSTARSREVRDLWSTLTVLSQCVDSEPSSVSETAERISKSGAPPDALQAAETYLQEVGGLSAAAGPEEEEAEGGHVPPETLLETLVSGSRRHEQPWVESRRSTSSIEAGGPGLDCKKSLADMSRRMSSARKIDLDCGPFLLERTSESACLEDVPSPADRKGDLPIGRDGEVLEEHSESSEPEAKQIILSTQFPVGENQDGDMPSLKSMDWDAIFRGVPATCTSGRDSGAEESRGSEVSSIDSMSDDAISERAGVWGTGVAKMVLQNSSQESSPRSSAQSLALEWHPRKSPRFSKSVNDVLSSFKIAFMVCDATDPRGPILYASSGFFRMTGYSAEEVIGKSCWFLEGEDTDHAEAARIRDAVKKGEAYSGIILNYKRIGTSFWNLFTLTPISDGTGKVIKYIGMQAEVSCPLVKSGRRELAVVPHWPSASQREAFPQAHQVDDLPALVTVDAYGRSKRSDPAQTLPVFAFPRNCGARPLGTGSSRYPLTAERCPSPEFRSEVRPRGKKCYSLTIDRSARPSMDCSGPLSAEGTPYREIERRTSTAASPCSDSGWSARTAGSGGSQPLMWHLAAERNAELNERRSALPAVEEELETREGTEGSNQPGGRRGTATKLSRGPLRILRLLGYLNRKLATATRQGRKGTSMLRPFDMVSESTVSRLGASTPTFAPSTPSVAPNATPRRPYYDLESEDSEAVRREIASPDHFSSEEECDMDMYRTHRRNGFSKKRSSDWSNPQTPPSDLQGCEYGNRYTRARC